MKNIYRTLIALSILFSLLASPNLISAQTPTPTIDPSLLASAEAFVTMLSEGAFEQASQTFDAPMQAAMSVSALEQAWETLGEQVGNFQKITTVTPTRAAGYQIIYVTTLFDKGSVDIKVVYNDTGQVSGLFFTPTGTGQLAAKTYAPAPYATPDSFTERQVSISSAENPLPGTLTLPKGQGPFPAVVLVHGSGPNDRDETLGPNKPFRDLAEGLSSQGIAVLRYDKRTRVYPEQMLTLGDQITVKEEVVDDALAALDLLRQAPEIDSGRIYLLGHSLGGMLVPRIAAQASDLAGAIILAGPTRPLEDLVVEQITYLAELDGSQSAEENAQIEQIKQQVALLKDPTLGADASSGQLLGAPASYWLDLREYDPAQAAATLDLPLLILQGQRDYQVTEADFNGWQAALSAKKEVYLKQYPGLNHLFIRGSGPSTPQEYERPGNVDELVIRDISDFVLTGKANQKIPLIGGIMTTQEITRLVLLLLPIFLIQAAISIYCLVDLSRRKKTHGPRWLWAVLLVLTLFTLPSGLLVAAIYLIWGRKEAEDEDGNDDPN